VQTNSESQLSAQEEQNEKQNKNWQIENEYLRIDLHDAHARIAELTTLVNHFAADARNNERTVIDML
jgi:hypothetical protein